MAKWAATLQAGALVFDLGGGVAGADIAPTAVQRTQTACAEHGLPFDGRVCDISALPWPDETFDAALSTSTIHYALRADVQRTIDEVWRILKPGGLFLVDFPCTDTASSTGSAWRRDGWQMGSPRYKNRAGYKWWFTASLISVL